MLARYKIYRGKRPAHDPLPTGIRQDTRWRTSHILRPTQQLVKHYLANPTDAEWEKYIGEYNKLLNARFRKNRKPFDDLAALASQGDVFIGCSCPTKKNPTPGHCHIYLALGFMRKRYPKLQIRFRR